MKSKKMTKLLKNVPNQVLMAIDAHVFKRPINQQDLEVAEQLGYFKQGKPTPKANYLVSRLLKIAKAEGLLNG